MKNLLAILILMFSLTAKSQIDLSFDASFIGIYPTAKVSYPLYDKVVVGGSYGYNMTNNLELTDRFNLVLGYKFDEWIQLEADFGFLEVSPYSRILNSEDLFNDYGNKLNKFGDKYYRFNVDFGVKAHFCNNMFATVQVAYPGAIKIGLGVRLRPYKQLTVWDKQG